MKKSRGKDGSWPGRKKRVPDAELDFLKILQQNSLFSVSTGSIMSPARKPLKAISYENIVAATRIQKIIRGFLCRKKLWKYEGVMMISCVIKVQRVWRGFQGRVKAFNAFKARTFTMGHRIIGLFYIWRYRRFKRILKAEITTRIIIRLQSHFRGIKARRLYARMLFKHRTRSAQKIQRVTRGYFGRRRARAIRKRLHQFYELMKLVRQMNITEDLSLLARHPHHVPQLTEWRIFLLGLLHQICSHNSEKSVACATELIQKYPNFGMSSFLLQFALLSAWASFGNAKVIREDFLEEAVESFIAATPLAFATATASLTGGLQKRRKRNARAKTKGAHGQASKSIMALQLMNLTSNSSSHKENNNSSNSITSKASFASTAQVPPHPLWGRPFRYRNLITNHSIDPVSQFYFGIPEEIEFMILKAGRMLGGRGAIQTMLMSTIVSINMQRLITDKETMKALKAARVAAQAISAALENDLHSNSVSSSQKGGSKNGAATPSKSGGTIARYASGKSGKSGKSGGGGSVSSEDSLGTLQTVTDPYSLENYRARILIHEARRRIMPEVAEEITLKADALVNIYVETPHTVVASRIINFTGCSLLRFDKKNKSNIRPSNSFPISATVQLISAGDSLIVRALLKPPSPADIPSIDNISEKFLVRSDILETLSGPRQSSKNSSLLSPSSSSSVVISMCDLSLLSVRPLVLLPKEVSMIKDLLARKRELQEIEKMEREIKRRKTNGLAPLLQADRDHMKYTQQQSIDLTWHYLTEFIFDHVRLVSCSTRKRNPFLSHSERTAFVDLSEGKDNIIDSDDDEDEEEMNDIQNSVAKMNFIHHEMLIHDGIFGNGDDDDVEGSGAELLGEEMIRWNASHTACWRICLPGAEYLRRERNASRMEELAIRLIQKIFRGFQGRARFRRLIARSFEKKRQQAAFSQRRSDLASHRMKRFLLASKVQARIRGVLMRLQLDLMRRMAIKIQTKVRGLLARRMAEKEKKRKEMGPEVIEEMRRSVLINNMTIVVAIYRCGHNYKINGQDIVNNALFECYCYQPEVEFILEEFNKKFPNRTVADRANHVRLWQYSRVCEVLLAKVRIIRRVTPLTRELGASRQGNNMEFVLFEKGLPSIRNLGDTKDLDRALNDQRDALRRYNIFLARASRAGEAQALAEKEALLVLEKEKQRLRALDKRRSKK